MFEQFKRLVRDDVDEFVKTGEIKAARELSQKTGQSFAHDDWPQFFTGQLDAKLVLVQLNPGPRKTRSEIESRSFDQYFDDHVHLGATNMAQDRKGIAKCRSAA